MSVIVGYGGYVELSREWPEPTAFPRSSLTSSNALLCREKAFWTGQRVLIYSDLGVPLRLNNSAYAPCPDGHRFWGGLGVMGPNTAHRTDNNGPFWKTDGLIDSFYVAGTPLNPAPETFIPGTISSPATDFVVASLQGGLGGDFWENQTSVGLQKTASVYIHRDPLDRITFYESENGAINRNPSQLIQLSPVYFDNLLIAPYNSSSAYIAAIEAIGEAIFNEHPTQETPASNYLDIPDSITDISSSPEARGWTILAGCREWALQTDPTILDKTAIGEDYGDSVKDVVRGAGSFVSFVNETQPNSGVIDARGFIRLAIMTGTGSRATARFRLQEQSPNLGCDAADSVWMECDILLGSGELRVTVDDTVRYSSEFVVVQDKDGVGVKPRIGVFPAA
jgi:hypothetical protein